MKIITLVDVLDFIINGVIGVDQIPEETKEQYLGIIKDVASDSIAKIVKDKINEV